jgi:flagellar hook-length control protein FliK
VECPATNPPAQPVSGQQPAPGRLFVAGWLLAVPEPEAAVPSETSPVGDDETVDAAAEPEVEGEQAQPAIVVPVVETLPQPIPAAAVHVVRPDVASTASTASTAPRQDEGQAGRAERVDAGRAERVEPLVRGQVEPAAQVFSQIVDGAEGSVAESGLPAAHTPARTVAPDVPTAIAQTVAATPAVQAAAQPAAEIVSDSQPVPAVAADLVTPAPRSRAAAQLSKAIERLGPSPAPAPVQGTAEVAAGFHNSSSSSGDQMGFGAHTTEYGRTAQPVAPAATTHLASFATQLTHEIRTSGTTRTAVADVPYGSAPAPDAETTQQIVQAIRVQFRDGIGSAVLRLKPEHLGEVSIALRVEQQSVSATVHAEVPAVRHWLEAEQGTLRTALSDQGLKLEELVVREDGERQNQGDADTRDDQRGRRQARPRRGDDDIQFEALL